MNPEQEPIDEYGENDYITFKDSIDSLPEDKAEKARKLQEKIELLISKRHMETNQAFSSLFNRLIERVSKGSSFINEEEAQKLKNSGLRLAMGGGTDKKNNFINYPLDIIVEEDDNVRPAELNEVGEYERFINEQIAKLEQESKE